MAREMVTVPGYSEQVYVVRFKDVKGYWVIVEGNPNDRHWQNWLGAQKIHRGKQLGETYYSGGSGADIVTLSKRANDFLGPMGRPCRVMVQCAPDDVED